MADRVDDNGAAFAGSQLQTQLYVNQRVNAVNDAIRAALPGLAEHDIEWRSPLAKDRYAEYWDKTFLERLDLGHHAAELKSFWPSGGPHWDALAVVRSANDERPGVLLAEGKSYPAELYGSGCQAKPGSASRGLIEKSLGWTQRQLGVEDKTPQDWCGPLYQSANRLAHVEWLRSLGVRAWFVHLLFTDDPIDPTDAQAWQDAVETAENELGLAGVTIPHAGHVLLPAGRRAELVDS